MEKARIRKEARFVRAAFPHRAALGRLVRGVLLIPLTVASALAGQEAENVTHFTDSSTDRPPAVTAFPKYPSVARRDRIEGEAMVCFNIDARGRVVRPSIRTSTHRIFEKPAMAAIRRSSFAPLAAGEKPAPAKTCRTYRFRLDPVNAENGERALPDDTTTPEAATAESPGPALDPPLDPPLD